MAKTALGFLSDVPWSTLKQNTYDVIIEQADDTASTSTVDLQDEEDKIVMATVTGWNKRTISLNATVIGLDHFGANSLINTVITTLSGADIPSPLLVTGNSRSRKKGAWMTCTLEAIYLGDDATEQTLDTSPMTTGTSV